MSDLPADLDPRLFEARRQRVLARLGRGAMVLPAPPVRYRSRDTEYPHRPDSELYYLTGLTEPEAVAVLRGGSEDPSYVLFVRDRDPSAELWTGPRLGPDGAVERFGADAAHPLEKLAERLPGLLEGADRIHFRLGEHPTVEPAVLGALREARIRGPRRGTGPRGVVDPGEILDEMRLRKDEAELALLRRAAAVTVAAFHRLLAVARPGVGEWELQAELEAEFRRAGGDGPAYETIVASGPNACVLHYVANRRRAEAGDLVLVDAGAAMGLYAADLTRTFPVSGSFTGPQRAVYEVVEAARRAAVTRAGPGVTVGAVHREASRVVTEGLVELGVVSGPVEDAHEAEAHKPFFPHRTSHWLGLDVHDVGDYAVDARSRVLEPGMVLSVEPGLYFGPASLADAPEAAETFRGIGVRIEDDIVVTADGVEVLTEGMPTDPDEVAAMAREG